MNKKIVKSLVLLSGGLDSILAVKLLLEQGILVEAVNFRTNFCGPSKARAAAEMLGVPLREVNIRNEFLPILKNPQHGYGAGLNPCIDCHGLMLKKAGEIMRQEKYDFVATGEVLGERPMSQHKQALGIVEKDADLKGYLLRPLSAKLLPPTLPEQDGRVDREKLLAISGRSRKIQIALAAQYGIKEYPTPAGGCALTEKDFAGRLKELMKNKPDFTPEDVDLVAMGRHFWIESFSLIPPLLDQGGAGGGNADRNKITPPPASPDASRGGQSSPHSKGGGNFNKIQIILGRSREENEILAGVAGSGDILVVPEDFPGPTALVRGDNEEAAARARELILEFSPKAKNLKEEEIRFKIIKKE